MNNLRKNNISFVVSRDSTLSEPFANADDKFDKTILRIYLRYEQELISDRWSEHQDGFRKPLKEFEKMMTLGGIPVMFNEM